MYGLHVKDSICQWLEHWPGEVECVDGLIRGLFSGRLCNLSTAFFPTNVHVGVLELARWSLSRKLMKFPGEHLLVDSSNDVNCSARTLLP